MILTHNQELMDLLDSDKSGTISMSEFDSNGQTSTSSGGDDNGAQVSNLQGSDISEQIILL